MKRARVRNTSANHPPLALIIFTTVEDGIKPGVYPKCNNIHYYANVTRVPPTIRWDIRTPVLVFPFDSPPLIPSHSTSTVMAKTCLVFLLSGPNPGSLLAESQFWFPIVTKPCRVIIHAPCELLSSLYCFVSYVCHWQSWEFWGSLRPKATPPKNPLPRVYR